MKPVQQFTAVSVQTDQPSFHLGVQVLHWAWDAAVNPPLHRHAFGELIYCVSDTHAEYLIDGDRYRVQQGDVVFVPPHSAHQALPVREQGEALEVYILCLPPQLLEFLGRKLPDAYFIQQEYPYRVRAEGPGSDRLKALFLACAEEYKRRQFRWEDALLGITMLLLAQLSRSAQGEASCVTPKEQTGLLESVMAYVDQNLSAEVTLADTARHFFVSESTISRLFRRELNLNFHRYVTLRRLDTAKRLLPAGLPLQEISSRVGFADYSSFYRAFKKEYGISPRQYLRCNEPGPGQNNNPPE